MRHFSTLSYLQPWASILRGFEGPDPREILLARVSHCLDPRKMSEARL